jgi:hypothetical protein
LTLGEAAPFFRARRRARKRLELPEETTGPHITLEHMRRRGG